MKSFVTTVVAALVAASGALANSTDASTSGTVPTLPDHCEFLNVSDGKMMYFPPEQTTQSVMMEPTALATSSIIDLRWADVGL